MRWTDADYQSFVERSPALVAEHDRAGWLGLFVTGGVVEDPYGSAAVIKGNDVNATTGSDALGRFWDTFIAPNGIRFEVHEDLVVFGAVPGSFPGVEAWVVRDVSIHTTVPSGVAITVPAYLIYELCTVDDALRVRRMAAHWELPKLSLAAMGQGVKASMSMTALFGRMIKQGGLGGVRGFMQAMHTGVFGRGKDAAERLCTAATAGDLNGLHCLMADSAPRIEWPIGEPLSAQAFINALPAGAHFELDRPISAGFISCARYALEQPGAASPVSRGLAFFWFDPQSRRITHARFIPGPLSAETEGSAPDPSP